MFQPSRLGKTTPCPRLEIGNGSAIPCSAPRIAPWRYEMGCTEPLRLAAGGGARRGSGLEPGEDEAADPQNQSEDAVLDVVVARPRFVPREEGRERSGGLGEIDDRDRDQDHSERDRPRDQLPVLGHRLLKSKRATNGFLKGRTNGLERSRTRSRR